MGSVVLLAFFFLCFLGTRLAPCALLTWQFTCSSPEQRRYHKYPKILHVGFVMPPTRCLGFHRRE